MYTSLSSQTPLGNADRQSYPCSQVKVGRACCVANECGYHNVIRVVAGMEEVGKSGERIEGKSASSISSGRCGCEEGYSLMSASS